LMSCSGAQREGLCDRVTALERPWRERVQVVVLDPFRGCATALP
jgi:hypothetical protein